MASQRLRLSPCKIICAIYIAIVKSYDNICWKYWVKADLSHLKIAYFCHQVSRGRRDRDVHSQSALQARREVNILIMAWFGTLFDFWSFRVRWASFDMNSVTSLRVVVQALRKQHSQVWTLKLSFFRLTDCCFQEIIMCPNLSPEVWISCILNQFLGKNIAFLWPLLNQYY